MNDIRESLTRKLGPLPFWAWAIIGGVGIYIYRARHAGTSLFPSLGSPGTTAPSTTSPDASATNTTPGSGDPTTLQPGESVYDPGTGQLTTAPGLPSDAVPPVPDYGGPLEPVTFDPGQTLYDPNTGKVVGGPVPPAKPPKGKPGKRKPKPKPKHTKAAKPPGNHKRKPRSVSKLINPLHRQRAGSGTPKQRTRGISTGSAPASRVRVPAKTSPAVRQHAEAPKITHPATQRVTKVRTPAHAPAPTPRRPAARKRK